VNKKIRFSIVFFILILLTLFTYSKSEKKIIPIPKPPLKHLEKSVAKELFEGRKMVDKVVSTKKVTIEKKAQAYDELARLYQTYELNDSAEACYKNALTLTPDDFRWKYSLAFLYQSEGDFTKGLKYYTSIKNNREAPIIKYLIKIRIGECYRKLNKIPEAFEAFNSAFKINPKDPAVLGVCPRLGGINLDIKKYKEAIKYLLAVIELNLRQIN